MLNFEMAKSMYETVFINKQHLTIGSINFQLGLVYLELRDYDNAKKCFEATFEIRKIYYKKIDEIVLIVVINLIKIFVE
jgi:tetratricopeptide (TPR) repeat protein